MQCDGIDAGNGDRTRLASKADVPRSDAAVDNYDLYLQASEEKHKLMQEAAREKEAILKELERTKDELKRSTRTAADAIESRCLPSRHTPAHLLAVSRHLLVLSPQGGEEGIRLAYASHVL